MNKNLDRIEAHLRKLIEKSLLAFVVGDQPFVSLVDELVKAVEGNLKTDSAGNLTAPDRLMINVPPKDFHEWQVHQDVLDEMADLIYEIGQDEGFSFIKRPSIEIHINTNLPKSEFSITTKTSDAVRNLPDTAAMELADQNNKNDELPNDAFLVIGGKTNFPLEKPVINIGRHSNNDLSLDDAHVSRHHAQLRAINNRFVIFDVGSTGGLFLNGRRISQATLQSGDVIRIGLVNLIYIQDTTAAHPTSAIPINSDEDLQGGKIE